MTTVTVSRLLLDGLDGWLHSEDCIQEWVKGNNDGDDDDDDDDHNDDNNDDNDNDGDDGDDNDHGHDGDDGDNDDDNDDECDSDSDCFIISRCVLFYLFVHGALLNVATM